MAAVLYLFTDGSAAPAAARGGPPRGARPPGAHCAGWGFAAAWGPPEDAPPSAWSEPKYVHVTRGAVEPRPGAEPTSNRGELSGVLQALLWAGEDRAHLEPPGGRSENGGRKAVVVVSDSTYALNSVWKWGPAWLKRADGSPPPPGSRDSRGGALPGAAPREIGANLDLVAAGVGAVAGLEAAGVRVGRRHVRAHQPQPRRQPDLFFWAGNRRVDSMAKVGRSGHMPEWTGVGGAELSGGNPI